MASRLSPPIYTPSSSTIQCTPFHICRYSPDHFFSFTTHIYRSSLLFPTRPNSWYRRCRAASPGPSSPPEYDPPTGEEPTSSSGNAATFSTFQDSLQIFFAVLFWMSLFFWASAWDGRNNGGSNKGSRFR